MWAAVAHSRGKLWRVWVVNQAVGESETKGMRIELGFIGFSCAAQCFLCALPFYPIFNDSFGKWVLTSKFLCLLLLHLPLSHRTELLLSESVLIILVLFTFPNRTHLPPSLFEFQLTLKWWKSIFSMPNYKKSFRISFQFQFIYKSIYMHIK